MIRSPTEPVAYDPTALETRIARLLMVGTMVGVALLAAGIGVMVAQGIDPLAAPGPVFRLDALVDDVLALRPDAFLGVGLLVVMALPVTRVAVAAAAFLRHGERPMTLVAATVLVVLALTVVIVDAQSA